MDNFPEINLPTAMAEAAGAMHELFTELTTAGFTENQALKLIAYQMSAMGGNENGSSDS